MGNKLYKILSRISIIGAFSVVAILVCSTTSIIKLNYVVGGVLAMIAVLCISCIMALNWVKQIENKNSKIFVIVFLSLIVFCAVLWIVFIFLVMNCTANDEPLGRFGLNWLRFSLIATTQLLVASTISNIVLKYKKSFITLQVITYLSNLFVDIFFTIFFVSLTIDDGGISFDKVPSFLGSRGMVTLLIIAFIYVCLSGSIMKMIDKRKLRTIMETSEEPKFTIIDETIHDANSLKIETKLLKLKDLLDKGLITQEDYETKKQDILKDM